MDIENSVIAYLDLDLDRSNSGEGLFSPPPPKRIELKETLVTFGRAIDNVVMWESLQISRRHAVMSYDNQIWTIKDTSTNGMLVNGRRLPQNEYVDLHHLDSIAFFPTGWPQYKFHQVTPAIPAAVPLRASSIFSPGESVQILAPLVEYSNISQTPKRKTKSVPSKISRVPAPTGRKSKRMGLVLSIPPQNEPSISPVNVATVKEANELDLKSIHGENSSRVKDLLQAYKDRIVELKNLASAQKRADSEMDEVLTDLRNQVSAAQSETRMIKEGLVRKIVEGVESEFSCGICNGVFIEATVMDCGHTFCAHCISEWVKRKSECPRCQKAVRIQVKHTDVENLITKFHGMLPEGMQKRREETIRDRAKEVAADARGLRSRRIRFRAPLSQWQQPQK